MFNKPTDDQTETKSTTSINLDTKLMQFLETITVSIDKVPHLIDLSSIKFGSSVASHKVWMAMLGNKYSMKQSQFTLFTPENDRLTIKMLTDSDHFKDIIAHKIKTTL